MSGVRMLHFLKDGWKFIQIQQYYTRKKCSSGLDGASAILIILQDKRELITRHDQMYYFTRVNKKFGFEKNQPRYCGNIKKHRFE